MGVIWSHGIKCDRLSMKKLIDNEIWFWATLIEYNNLSGPPRNDWNLSLGRNYETKSSRNKTLYKVFKKRTKSSGRISIQENCIVFQGLDCGDLLRAIVSRQQQSPVSHEKSLSNSPTSLTNDPCYYNLQSSTSPNGKEDTGLSSPDRLNTFVWPINAIRNFGYKNDFFSFDSGRFSPTGEGRFTFKIKNATTFISIFQNSYCQCSQTTRGKYSPVSSISPYYNLTTSRSYRNISNPFTTPHSDKSYPIKTKSIEFTFDTNNKCSDNEDSVFPINYSSIDFSHDYVNSKDLCEGKCSNKEVGFDFRNRVRDSIYYLTICENQTKAVEEVLKRIG